MVTKLCNQLAQLSLFPNFLHPSVSIMNFSFCKLLFTLFYTDALNNFLKTSVYVYVYLMFVFSLPIHSLLSTIVSKIPQEFVAVTVLIEGFNLDFGQGQTPTGSRVSKNSLLRHDVISTKFEPRHSNPTMALYLPAKFQGQPPKGSRISKISLLRLHDVITTKFANGIL